MEAKIQRQDCMSFVVIMYDKLHAVLKPAQARGKMPSES
jgi:hypothetical protein